MKKIATLIIDLPENCMECPLANYQPELEKVTCLVRKKLLLERLEDRPKWCPLIPMESMEDIVDENKRAETLKRFVWGNVELAKENDKWAEKIGGIYRE